MWALYVIFHLFFVINIIYHLIVLALSKDARLPEQLQRAMAAEAEAAREARAKVIMMMMMIVMMMMLRWSPLRGRRRPPRRWERPRTQYPSHQQLSSSDISRLSWPLIGQCWSRDLNTVLWLVIVSPVLQSILYIYIYPKFSISIILFYFFRHWILYQQRRIPRLFFLSQLILSIICLQIKIEKCLNPNKYFLLTEFHEGV